MDHQDNATMIAWPLALASAAVLGTLATACMMPFVAVATVASATLPRTQGLIAVFGVWLANQLLGFGLLGYPLTAYALVWGAALGGASLAAWFVSGRLLNAGAATLVRLAVAFGAAFAAYEALLFCFALIAGGVATFSPAIILRILANEAGWLAGLLALHAILTRVAPRTFGYSTKLRIA